MTITVTNTELRPDLTPKPFGAVKVGIVNAGWQGDGSIILDIAKGSGDINGLVSIDLAPSPAGTWYVWNHSDRINQSVFTVPASGGPYTLQTLLVTAPTAAADPATTQAAVLALLAGFVATGDFNALWSAAAGDMSVIATAVNAYIAANLITGTTRTNLAKNPNSLNTSGWVSGSSSLYGTSTADTVNARRAGTSARKLVRTTTTPSTTIAQWSWVGQSGSSATSGSTPVTVGTQYTATVHVMCSVAARARSTVNFYDNTGTLIGGSSVTGAFVALTANAWTGDLTSPTVTATAPAGAVTMSLVLNVNTNSGNTSGGETAWTQDMLVETGATVGSYFDGDVADTTVTDYGWTGTAEASPSTATPIGPLEGTQQGPAITARVLREWTTADAYTATSAIVYDPTYGVVSSATITWPDGATGTYTATTINPTFGTVDAYTITHSSSGKTVTQAAVTRDTSGRITAQPALTIA